MEIYDLLEVLRNSKIMVVLILPNSSFRTIAVAGHQNVYCPSSELMSHESYG